MTYQRTPINPGSSEEFILANQDRFAAQAAAFAELMRSGSDSSPFADLGKPATAKMVEMTNSRPPELDPTW